MFKPPEHNKTVCVGVHLNGKHTPCGEPIEPGSLFPFCPMCMAALKTTRMTKRCSGALIYDAAMRPGRIECENDTGDQQTNLCASCRIEEKKSRDRARKAFQDKCPTCGQNMSGARAARAAPPPSGYRQQQESGRPYANRSPGSYQAPRSSPPTSRSGLAGRPYAPPQDDDD